MRGVVKKVVEDRGFGFIHEQGSTSRAGVFFHVRDIDMKLPFDGTLLERDVEYELVTKDGRTRAVNVRPAN